MINPKDNDERNEIMRKFKFQQLKKHKLHEFSRKERENLIIVKDSQKAQKQLEADNDGRASTAATTVNSASQDAAPNLKDLNDDQQKRVINSEFMDYMGSFVTKNNVKSLPGTVNHSKAEAERRTLLSQIRSGEDDDAPEPDVTEIAHYVQDQLQVGWKSVGKTLNYQPKSTNKNRIKSS